MAEWRRRACFETRWSERGKHCAPYAAAPGAPAVVHALNNEIRVSACRLVGDLGRKTRSAFFTPIILASAFFTRSLRVFFKVILRFFYLPDVRVSYSDPPPRFLPRFGAFLRVFSFLVGDQNP